MNFLVKITLAMALLISLTGKDISAQQSPQFSMYMFNPLAVNSAYAGSKDVLSITELYRAQWTGFNGNPVTQTFTIHSPLKNESLACGLSVINDMVGTSVKNTELYGNFAYRVKLNDKNDKLSFGLKAGVDLYSSDFRDLKVQDDSDEVYYTPLENKVIPNFGLGVYYFGKMYFVGLAIPKLIRNELTDEQTSLYSINNKHIYVMAGYVFEMNSSIDFKPSFNVKYTENAPISTDINASFLFNKTIWLGAMYRLNESFGANVMLHVSEYLRIGYAYDFTTTAIGSYSSGSHEIMLGIDLRNKRKSNANTPSYF